MIAFGTLVWLHPVAFMPFLPLDINQFGVFNIIIGCQITRIYYYGSTNFMLQR
jgi:hypothetical protein